MRTKGPWLTIPGWVVLSAVGALWTVGLLALVAAEGQAGVPLHVADRQLFFIIVAIVLAWVCIRIGYQRLGRWSYALFVASLALLVLLVLARICGGLPLIRPIKGAYRWIDLGWINLQPSEVMKVAYLLALGWYLKHKKNHQTLSGLIGPFALTVVPMFLTLLQPDLGTTLLLMPVLFLVLFATGARLKHLVGIVGLAILVAPILWGRMEEYQRGRIVGLMLQNESVKASMIDEPEKWTWLTRDPEMTASGYEHDDGFQLLRSKAALSGGGLNGRGWKQGLFVQYGFLPERHNDFIFAIIGEQWGTVGCLVVMLCYLVIAVAGLEIASSTSEPFGKLLAVGVVAQIVAQVFINVGMTMGLMPVTGMTLPFVSYGGSSMFVSMVQVALLISVSRYRPYLLGPRPFEGSLLEYAGLG